MSIEQKIIDIINTNSYITIDAMMEIALSRTPDSYYRTKQAIGSSQDFITAPEISQMFGEMIAVWTTLQWQSLGLAEINIVELGSGTGTLMLDVLRTIERIQPQLFSSINKIVILEINEVLKEIQKQKLAKFAGKIVYIKNIKDLPQHKSIIIANEFFDAMPIKQHQKIAGK